MYNSQIHQLINNCLQKKQVDIAGKDNLFYTRFVANTAAIHYLYNQLYQNHPQADQLFEQLIHTITDAYLNRPGILKELDEEKEVKGNSKDIENIFMVLKELIEKQSKPVQTRNKIGFKNYD